jgi:hypothetical protein
LDIIAVVLLLGCAAVIYFSCEAFVNGVEWLGHRLHLGQTATGTVLAAFGTALPESVVTLVAVAFGNTPWQKEIGIGAALGGPLALSTVAYAVVGLALVLKSRRLRPLYVEGAEPRRGWHRRGRAGAAQDSSSRPGASAGLGGGANHRSASRHFRRLSRVRDAARGGRVCTRS